MKFKQYLKENESRAIQEPVPSNLEFVEIPEQLESTDNIKHRYMRIRTMTYKNNIPNRIRFDGAIGFKNHKPVNFEGKDYVLYHMVQEINFIVDLDNPETWGHMEIGQLGKPRGDSYPSGAVEVDLYSMNLGNEVIPMDEINETLKKQLLVSGWASAKIYTSTLIKKFVQHFIEKQKKEKNAWDNWTSQEARRRR